MKPLPAVLATISTTSILWLGASFTMTAEPDPAAHHDPPSLLPLTVPLALEVEANRPDSHRLGPHWTELGVTSELPTASPDQEGISTLILDLAAPQELAP